MKEYFGMASQSLEVLGIFRKQEEESVVIMSIQEYNSLTETAYLLSTAANRKRLHESIEQAKAGEAVPFEA